MKQERLMPGAVMPVDVETTAALINEITHLIEVVRCCVTRPCEWVGLTFDDLDSCFAVSPDWIAGARWAEVKLKEKNA